MFISLGNFAMMCPCFEAYFVSFSYSLLVALYVKIHLIDILLVLLKCFHINWIYVVVYVCFMCFLL